MKTTRTKIILKLSMLWRIFRNPCFKRMLFDWKSHGFLYQPIKSRNNGVKFLSSLIFWCTSPTIGGNRHIHQVSYSSRKNCTLLLIKMILNFESIWPVHILIEKIHQYACIFVEKWVVIFTILQALMKIGQYACIFIYKIYQRENDTSLFFSTNNNFDKCVSKPMG